MQAAWYTENGAARDVLKTGEFDTINVRPSEVLVRVHYSAVNPSDTNRRRGSLGHQLQGPTIPHYDGAGIVEQVGAGVSEDWIGKRVWINIGGGYSIHGTAAQYSSLPLERIALLPDNTSFKHGACLGVPAMTAYCCLFSRGSIAGKSVMVTGGAGAVGHYAIQLAKWAGARVLTTVSSDKKRAVAEEAGADQIVNYRADNVTEAVLDFTRGEGVDLVVDVDIAANISTLVPSLKVGGRIATYASQSDHNPGVPAYDLMRRAAQVEFVLLPVMHPDLRAEGRAGVTAWLETGQAKHWVAKVFDLEDVADAHELVEEGSKIGCALVKLP